MNDGSSCRKSESGIKIGFSAIRTVLGILLVVIGMITLAPRTGSDRRNSMGHRLASIHRSHRRNDPTALFNRPQSQNPTTEKTDTDADDGAEGTSSRWT